MENRSSKDSSRKFSLGEIGLTTEDVSSPELQMVRETSILKRGSIISELSSLSSLYNTNNSERNLMENYNTIRHSLMEQYNTHYDENDIPLPVKSKKTCCIIS